MEETFSSVSSLARHFFHTYPIRRFPFSQGSLSPVLFSATDAGPNKGRMPHRTATRAPPSKINRLAASRAAVLPCTGLTCQNDATSTAPLHLRSSRYATHLWASRASNVRSGPTDDDDVGTAVAAPAIFHARHPGQPTLGLAMGQPTFSGCYISFHPIFTIHVRKVFIRIEIKR